MSVTQFPPKASASVLFVDAAAANTIYQQALNLAPGIYTVSCVSTTNTTIDFWASDNSLILSVTTVSGTVTAALTSASTRITYTTNTGSNIRIGLQLSGVLVGSGTTGTLDTITASGTYTPASPGVAYACAIGGGGGGGSGAGGFAGGGGGSGRAAIGKLQLTGSGISVVLGAGGAANGAGGTTTFGSLTATGGSPGTSSASSSGVGGSGGSGGGGGGGGGGGTGGANGANGNNGGFPGSGAGGAGSGVSVSQFVVSTGGTANTGGGIYGGGGGGSEPSGGGGGGGGVAGSNASGTTGGAGGAGRVFVLRWV